MNRKLSKILGVFLILTLCTSIVSFAESKFVIQVDEQKKVEIEKLYQRAKQGISDIEVEGLSKAIFTNKETAEIIEKETITTTQLLDTIEVDGETEKRYRTIVFLDQGDSLRVGIKKPNTNIVSIENFNLGYIPTAVSKPDPSYGVIAYIDIDWRVLTINGEQCIKMSRVDVWWDHQDNTISISNREVGMRQVGRDAYGNNKSNQVVAKTPSSNSASYSNPHPSSWVAVQDEGTAVVNATSNCILRRGGSEWDLFLMFRIRP